MRKRKIAGLGSNRQKWKRVCFKCRFQFYDPMGKCENKRCALLGKRLELKIPSYVELL
jgi:hypothetical protein